MQKPLSLGGQGFALEHFTTILQQTSAKKQLNNCIDSRSLTDSLNILENSGYTGDLAIFILANLQGLEVGG